MPLTAPQHAVMQRNPWFQQLPAALSGFLLAQGMPRRLNPGQHLFLRGDAPDGLYALVEGTLAVSGVHEDGREAMLSILEPSAWFGEIALFDHLPRTHHVAVISRQPALVLHVSQADIEGLLEDHPAYWRDFGVLLAQKTRLFMVNMEDSALMSPEQRLARRLVWSAHMMDPNLEMPVCRLPFSQANLASMLALSRQTVNQLLGGLQEAGLIRVSYGVIEVLDRVGLVMAGQVSVREAELLGARLPSDPSPPLNPAHTPRGLPLECRARNIRFRKATAGSRCSQQPTDAQETLHAPTPPLAQPPDLGPEPDRPVVGPGCSQLPEPGCGLRVQCRP